MVGMSASAGAQDQAHARPNRLALGIGYGIGTASLGDYHDAAAEVGANKDDLSNFQMNVDIGLRYYAPYHILAQVGVAGLYNQSSGSLPGQDLAGRPVAVAVDTHQIMIESSIMVGGYYSVFDALNVYALGGLSIAAKGWQLNDPGDDFVAGSGVGFRGLIGAEYFLLDTFALSLEIGYRHVAASDLVNKDNESFNFRQSARLPQSDASTDLDFSGITAQLNLRIFMF